MNKNDAAALWMYKKVGFEDTGYIDERVPAKWFGISALQVLGICIGVVLLWKAVELAWCVPPSYELLGGGWKEADPCG